MDSTITNKTAPLWVPRVIEERAWSHLGVREPPAEVKWGSSVPLLMQHPILPPTTEHVLGLCQFQGSVKT